jgi:hypothetical protein
VVDFVWALLKVGNLRLRPTADLEGLPPGQKVEDTCSALPQAFGYALLVDRMTPYIYTKLMPEDDQNICSSTEVAFTAPVALPPTITIAALSLPELKQSTAAASGRARWMTGCMSPYSTPGLACYSCHSRCIPDLPAGAAVLGNDIDSAP